MHFGEALGLLAIVTIAAIILRSYWFRMSPALQKYLLIASGISVFIRFLFLVTQWSTASPRFNSVVFWIAVVGYEIILLRFSLMRPRWLTSLCAIILILPLCGSTLLLPLTGLFEKEPHNVRRLAKNYVLERAPWDPGVNGHEGEDFMVLYNPSMVPFLHRLSQRSSFSKQQCNTTDVTVEVKPPKKLVHFRCPGYKGESDTISLILPLK
jgi:hypothetical protein